MSAAMKFSPGKAAALKPRTLDVESGEARAAAAERPANPITVLDTRPEELAAIPSAGDVVVDADLERALQGSPALRDPGRVSFIKKLIRNAHARWHEAARTYLEIGSELLAASEHLGRDYDRVVEGRLLPFSKSIETQLRAVARAVQENRLPADRLPGYSVAYKLSLLPDPLLQQAKEDGLVRPSVTRREVEEYRARAVRTHEQASGKSLDTLTLTRRRDDLLRRRGRLQGEIDTISAHLADIEAQLRQRGVLPEN
ncbi:hypothetical protein [Paracraurococcus lichenis]|uniref:DUF3102 domain-containing protein n=1 Tax=Paracraurococcus lichenis TaxID=3064888 RepID=A0ABT9EBW0_9PROT|nr:hypothetical protein [Paracraurococcus sp. LOR1-02]MDO9713710.1 hypothetical protein [Paracraurococcus sp. LOR1-02]